ncbi:hypothetical protein BT93_K0891 [Corymbia citriodora subsp. variegata]|nr:hypothetical protein BT93_K0891 [Corymbia citriodora subsp. variegata]KAF8006718.1 hypothetical protein BT93_K0891 [Corymbia citriodora subsp. variegata]
MDAIDEVVFTSSATAVIWTDDRKSQELDFDEEALEQRQPVPQIQAVARAVEDPGGESGVGPGDGPRGERGVRWHMEEGIFLLTIPVMLDNNHDFDRTCHAQDTTYETSRLGVLQ